MKSRRHKTAPEDPKLSPSPLDPLLLRKMEECEQRYRELQDLKHELNKTYKEIIKSSLNIT